MQDKAQEGRKRYNHVNGDRSGLGLTYLFDTAQLLILWFLALFLFEQEEVLDVERLHILYLRYAIILIQIVHQIVYRSSVVQYT